MIKTTQIAAAVKDMFKGGVNPAADTNTHATLSSQDEPPKRPEGEYDGEMPKSNAMVSDRARVLKEISDRRNAQVVGDAEEGNAVYNGTAVEETEAETAPPDTEIKGADIEGGDEPTAPETPAAPVVAAAPEETRTLIVDGVQRQVPLSQIIERGTATLQKEVAADARLEQANRLLAEAQRVAAQAPPSKDVAQAPAVEAMNDDQLAELIQFGTKEQAAQAIKILRSSAQPAVKVEDIVRAAQQAVAPQIAFEKGKDYAIAEYGDLLQDPDLGAIFLNRENVARKSGDTRPFTELYKAIGDEMRTKFNRPKPGPAGAATPTPKSVASTVPTRTMQEKQAAKAAAPSLPRLASARLDGDANTPRPPSRAEMFASMRRARGFTQGKDL